MQQPRPNSVYDKLIIILARFYNDLTKNIITFCICIAAFVLLALIYNVRKSNVYNCSFTVLYEDLVRKVYGDRIDKLDLLINTNKPKARAILQIDNKSIDALKKVSATNILGEKLSKDMNTDRIPFIVNMSVTDTTYISKLQNAILLYLESGNTYLADKRRLRIKELKDEMEFIDRQLNMMDTLKRKYYLTGGGGSTTTSGEKNISSESSVYQISYDLYKKRQELIKKLDMPMNLYVIDDAIVPAKSTKPYSLLIIAGLIAGFITYMFMVYIVMPVVRYKN